jgi:hypothetical protein
MFTMAKSASNAMTTRSGANQTLNMVKSPAMKRAYTSEVTVRNTTPMMNTFLREPVWSVRASSTPSTHSEQGLKPSTKAISAVLRASDCVARSTDPMKGTPIRPDAAPAAGGAGAGAGSAGGGAVTGVGTAVAAGVMTPAPASGQPVRTQASTVAAISAPMESSLKPTQ